MPGTKRPRRKYRPKPTMLPPSFGITAGGHRELAMRERASLEAVLTHTAEREHMLVLVSAAVMALRTAQVAQRRPDWHTVPPEQIDALLDRVRAVAPAAGRVLDRYGRLGQIGCSGQDRADLIELLDIIDVMREALPRRVWSAGITDTLATPIEVLATAAPASA